MKLRHRRRRIWRGEREVMQNRSNRGSGKPVWVRALHQRALVIGTRSANRIRASGHEYRINRPDDLPPRTIPLFKLDRIPMEGRADVGFRANTGRSVDPRWMSAYSHKRKYYLLPGQLNVQITSDVDLNKLRQPHFVRHACEPLDQPVLGPVGAVNNTPLVQWPRFIAADRVLDVK